MKVALIESHAVPGVWKYDLGLARELSRLGAQVTIITAKSFPHVEGTLFDGPIFREFPDLRAHTSLLTKGAYYVLGIIKTLRRLWTGHFDVIHWQLYNTLPPAETFMAKMLLGLRERLVITVHDVSAWSVVKGNAPLLLQATYQSAQRLIVHHVVNREELIAAYHLPRERIHVVPHGSFTHFSTGNLDRQLSRKLLGIPEDGHVLLFFGEIRAEKGLIYLIRAIKTVLAQIPDVRLVVAGRPRHMDMSDCLSEIRDLGLADAVILRLEHIRDELVQAYFSMTDIVVLPYIAITQSGVLLEALTVGRPVVVTDVGALGPTVQESQAGHVVPPGQVQPLADAIVDILRNPDLARQMSEHGRQAALETYSWSRCARETLAIYQAL
jgi:glycosyltransferase involved in cell wall biosynthesis